MQPKVVTSFEIVDAHDRTVGAFKFQSQSAALLHALDLLRFFDGPYFVAEVIERTVRQVNRERSVPLQVGR